MSKCKRRGQGDRPDRAVRRYAQVVHRRQGRNLLAREDAAAMADIHLHDVDRAGRSSAENRPRVISRSPAAIGKREARLTSANNSTRSGLTGSSHQVGS